MHTDFLARRENRERGHVARCVAPYSPAGGLPPEACARRPRMCVFHDEGAPREFIAFGGDAGLEAVLEEVLGPLRPG